MTILALKETVGVCGIITTWNFPTAMITRGIAPALAAGCSVVIKPPSETPFTCITLIKLALQAGFIPGLLHIVPTRDHNASLVLASHPKVKKLSFTRSTTVGKTLAKLADDTMKRISMELGGNAAFIVFEDFDLDKAVDGALVCKFLSLGQTCVCVNRIIVHQNVLEDCLAKLV
jgi:succinate-semialdehyde dehydrogenase / glutarate-semialdehyde dehydrogenase